MPLLEYAEQPGPVAPHVEADDGRVELNFGSVSTAAFVTQIVLLTLCIGGVTFIVFKSPGWDRWWMLVNLVTFCLGLHRLARNRWTPTVVVADADGVSTSLDPAVGVGRSQIIEFVSGRSSGSWPTRRTLRVRIKADHLSLARRVDLATADRATVEHAVTLLNRWIGSNRVIEPTAPVTRRRLRNWFILAVVASGSLAAAWWLVMAARALPVDATVRANFYHIAAIAIVVTPFFAVLGFLNKKSA